MKHIGQQENEWTAETDPTVDLDFALVQSAILAVVADLYRCRDDDADLRPEPIDAGAYFKPNLRRKLHPLRRPSLA